MSIWNKRFSTNGWSTVQKYSKVARNGYCIEALILSINMIFPHWGNDYFKEKYIKATEYDYEHSQQALLLADNQYILSK